MEQVAEIQVVNEADGEHLTPMEVAAYVDGTASADVRTRINAHLGECDVCRDEVVDTTRIAARLPRTRRTVFVRWIPAAIAAAVLLVIVSPNPLRQDAGHRESPVTTTVVPGPVSPIGTVDSLSSLLWTSVPNADRYDVRVFSADGSVLWEQATNDTTLTVPSTIILQPGRTYYWKVEAQTGFDRRVASDLIEFSVRSPRRR